MNLICVCLKRSSSTGSSGVEYCSIYCSSFLFMVSRFLPPCPPKGGYVRCSQQISFIIGYKPPFRGDGGPLHDYLYISVDIIVGSKISLAVSSSSDAVTASIFLHRSSMLSILLKTSRLFPRLNIRLS